MKSALMKLSVILLLSLTASLFNVTLAQDSLYIRIPVWRSRMIAQELIRFDSLMSEHKKTLQDLKDMQEIARTRLRMINILNLVLSEKELQVEIQQQKVKEAMKFEQIARKYKRQRNITIAGVTLVVVGGIVKTFLKR